MKIFKIHFEVDLPGSGNSQTIARGGIIYSDAVSKPAKLLNLQKLKICIRMEHMIEREMVEKHVAQELNRIISQVVLYKVYYVMDKVKYSSKS